MSRRRRKADDSMTLAADLGREDGTDPKEFHSKPWNTPKQAGRKAQQFCAQVREALQGILAACADEALQGLAVVAVEPAPHTGRLRVVLTPGVGGDRAAAEAALHRAAGFLRT